MTNPTTTVKRWLLASLAIGCLVAAVIAVTAQPAGTVTTPLYDAVAGCDVTGEPGAEVLDDGTALAINALGDDGIDLEAVACLLVALDMPGAVVEQMDRTRALDGTQEADWDDMAASWTYHPDAGLNVLVTWERS